MLNWWLCELSEEHALLEPPGCGCPEPPPAPMRGLPAWCPDCRAAVDPLDLWLPLEDWKLAERLLLTHLKNNCYTRREAVEEWSEVKRALRFWLDPLRLELLPEEGADLDPELFPPLERG